MPLFINCFIDEKEKCTGCEFSFSAKDKTQLSFEVESVWLDKAGAINCRNVVRFSDDKFKKYDVDGFAFINYLGDFAADFLEKNMSFKDMKKYIKAKE